MGSALRKDRQLEVRYQRKCEDFKENAGSNGDKRPLLWGFGALREVRPIESGALEPGFAFRRAAERLFRAGGGAARRGAAPARGQSCSASQRSASSAAMQPMPAEVIAWR